MKRTIFLVDMNAFFVSCEMSRNTELKGKPAAVAGNPEKRTGIILAANYEARRYGIKTAMTVSKAKQLFPDLVTVSPDHDFYQHKSREFMSLLQDYSPVIEPNSIDEAWLDLTGCEGIYKSPFSAAEIIMQEIKSRLDLSCSIGISENKFLAKMASDMKKPMGITELWQSDIMTKMWPLPVSNMYGIGSKTAFRLSKCGITTIGDLAQTSAETMNSILGKNGLLMHRHANGIDDEPVVPHTNDEIKSIGRSVTLPQDINDPVLLRPIMIKLADEVAAAARKTLAKGNVIRINLKFKDFTVISRQETVHPTNSGNDIFQTGYSLLLKNWQSDWSVRLIGITLAGFDHSNESQQLTIFDLTDQQQTHKPNKQDRSAEAIVRTREKLDAALDTIKEKHGNGAVTRASLIKFQNKSFPGMKSTEQEDNL